MWDTSVGFWQWNITASVIPSVELFIVPFLDEKLKRGVLVTEIFPVLRQKRKRNAYSAGPNMKRGWKQIFRWDPTEWLFPLLFCQRMEKKSLPEKLFPAWDIGGISKTKWTQTKIILTFPGRCKQRSFVGWFSTWMWSSCSKFYELRCNRTCVRVTDHVTVNKGDCVCRCNTEHKPHSHGPCDFITTRQKN
jgi:hypothetical protein